jgi:lysozyme
MTDRPKTPRSTDDDCGCKNSVPKPPKPLSDEDFESKDYALGVDVSHHNGDVDWLKVRKAGYSFTFLKATEGVTYTDPTFGRNRDRSAAAGLYVGAYHFYRTTSGAAEQANHFCDIVGSMRNGELPPVLDIEDESQWKKLSSDEAIKLVLTWLTTVRSRLGVAPLVYASPSFINDILANAPALKEFALWLANYNVPFPSVPGPWTSWTFWQYSEHGRVDGITTDTDLNRFNGTEAQLSGMIRHATELRPLTTVAYHWWLRVLMWMGF